MITEATLLKSSNPRVPEVSHPFRHAVDVQTRFADIDMLGHVNNNAYFAYMDLGKLDYFRAISGGEFSVNDLRAVVVNVTCDFFEPSYLSDQLKVWTSVTHIGNRSFVMEQRIVDTESGATKCIGRTTLAGFDPASGQGAPLDEWFVEMTCKFEGITRKI